MKGTEREEQKHISLCVCVSTSPSLLVSCLLISVREKNILGQHAELFIWKQVSLNL